MAETFHCWQCGKSLSGLILPMSRREECASCGADQHVCRMCLHFEDKGRGDCSEPRAELVSDRERANFCDYFKPEPNAGGEGFVDKSAEAKAKLAALFGDDDGNAEPSQIADGNEEKELTPAELAEKKLREMLGGS